MTATDPTVKKLAAAKALAPKADVFAASIAKYTLKNDLGYPAFDTIRDACDARTGGELDCFQLDILADMTDARLRKELACLSEV